MSDKNNYYGLGSFANVMETVMQNEVDILIDAEHVPTKPSFFKRLMNGLRPTPSATVEDVAAQHQENSIGSSHPTSLVNSTQ